MKRYLLALFIAAFSIGENAAQITVTQADMASIGDTVFMAYDTLTPPLPVGGTGNQSWDFSTMQMDFYDSLRFLDPAATPPAASFPNADLAMEGDPNIQPFAYLYFISNPAILAIDGFYANIPMGPAYPLNLSNNQTIIEFPSTYLSAFQDTSLLDTLIETTFTPLVDSARIKRITYINSTVDAWGNVITPAGTYNSIRQYREETAIDSIWAKPFMQPWGLAQTTTTVTYAYSWYANGEDMSVIDIVADAPGGIAQSANFIIGSTVFAIIDSSTNVLCNSDCTGDASANGLSGTPPYSFLWDANAGNQTTQTATGLCAGTYTVSVMDANNDTSTTTVTITEPSALSAIITGITHALCDTCCNGSVAAAGTGGTPIYSFSWNTNPPQTGQIATGLCPGTYEVTITDANGCTAVNSVVVTDASELVALKKKIKLYPNPSTGTFRIELNSVDAGKVSIHNLLGELLFEESVNKDALVVNMPEMNSGVYFVKIETAAGTITKKLNLIK